MSRYEFRIPCSTSNLGAGFDALSLALNRYLVVAIDDASDMIIEARGTDAASIPTTPDNLVLRVARSVAERRGRVLAPFRMTIENEIPLARGMGSSAAAIIAGITVYELLMQDRLVHEEIFRYAREFEPHPDNLAAALYGGLVVAASADDGNVWIAELTVPAGVTPIVVIPDFELSTEKARAVLPESYSRKDVVYNLQRGAMTIAALTTGNWSLLRESMRDRIHQPYRAPLIPGLKEILESDLPGLLGIALSGAGPTVFALARSGQAEQAGSAIAAIFGKFNVRATPHVVEIDRGGRSIRE